MKTVTVKGNLFAMLLCLALVLPLDPVWAQDTDKASPDGGQAPSLKAPKIQGAKTVTAIINTVVGYVAKIGGIFGKSAGTRIGGTSVSAIAMLVIAKLVQDKTPSWVQWLLYLSGGTMAVGSGANITQMIMRALS